jgi:hypothetical protein
MTTWVEQLQHKAAIVHDQILAAKEMQKQTGVDLSGVIEGFYAKLSEIYSENYPLAHVMDISDIVLHAEGPAASNTTPALHAFNWLTTLAEKQLLALATATFQLNDENAKKLVKQIDLRITGLAPGSLYVGFKLQEPVTSGLFSEIEDPVFVSIRDAIHKLSDIPNYVGDEKINEEINEAIPDIAIRDALLTAAMRLAPTGKIGIHTIELFSPTEKRPSTELSQRERVVLREALKRPKLSSPKTGAFVGEIREIDLDVQRFHLRGVKGFGTLRCFFPEKLKENETKGLLGSHVEVLGSYEEDKNGRPRLMSVSEIKEIKSAVQQSLSEIY